MRSHCQICNRAKPVGRDGIVRHYVRGSLCLGTWNPPVEVSAAAIPSALEHWKLQAIRYQTRLDLHKAARANEDLPGSFYQAWADCLGEIARLERRFARLTKRKALAA